LFRFICIKCSAFFVFNLFVFFAVYSGSTVTIYGKNFPYAFPCSAYYGTSASAAVAAESCLIFSSKLIAIRLNSATSGSANVYVFMNDELFALESQPFPLTIYPTPTISSILPSSGYVGSHITVLGLNFATDSTCSASVTLMNSNPSNSIAAALCSLISGTMLSIVIGAGSSIGASSLTVSIASFPGSLQFSILDIVALPSISSFFPVTAYAGCKVTIAGASFIQKDYTCVAFVGNPLSSAVASRTCDIISSNTIIFTPSNGTKVQANALIQVAFNVVVRATPPDNSFLSVVLPPGPGAVPAIEIWFEFLRLYICACTICYFSDI
jgi:hypothetical protein